MNKNIYFSKSMGVLYFVVAPSVGRIKIGATSKPLSKRFPALLAGSPVPLYVLGYVKTARARDAFALEKEAHRVLNNIRAHHEWFEYGDRVREYAASLIWDAEPGFGYFGYAIMHLYDYASKSVNEHGRRVYAYTSKRDIEIMQGLRDFEDDK